MTYITCEPQTDGFGSQFQRYVWTAIYLDTNDMSFSMPHIVAMQHNYDNNNGFVNDMMDFTTLYELFPERPALFLDTDVRKIYKTIDFNIDYYYNCDLMETIRKSFLSKNNLRIQKMREYPMKPHAKHICVHLRVSNVCDNRTVPYSLEYYTMRIREALENIDTSDDCVIHIVSQTKIDELVPLFEFVDKNERNGSVDVQFHLNADLKDSFCLLVAADHLIIAESSLSYIAAWFTKGKVYYRPFWHKPHSSWYSTDDKPFALPGLTDYYMAS